MFSYMLENPVDLFHPLKLQLFIETNSKCRNRKKKSGGKKVIKRLIIVAARSEVI